MYKRQVLVGDGRLDGDFGKGLVDLGHHAGDGEGIADENRLGEFALHTVQQTVLPGQIDASQSGEEAGPQHAVAHTAGITPLLGVFRVDVDRSRIHICEL